MGGSARRALHVFQRVCGKENYKNVVLATIFWNKTEHGSQEGLNRETQLLETEGFWKSMKDVGAEVARLSEDYHGTVPALLRMARQPKIVPNMESELKNGVPLENTMAGLYIHHNRSELEEKYEEEIAEMRFHFNCRMEEQEQQKTEAAARSHELLKAKDDEIAAMRRSVEAMGERLAGLEQSQRSRQADLETELRNIRATEREERQRHISAEERLRNIASQQESKLRYRISFAHHKKVELQLQIFHRACNTGISPIRVPEIAPNGSASRSGRNYWCDFCSTPFGMGLMYYQHAGFASQPRLTVTSFAEIASMKAVGASTAATLCPGSTTTNTRTHPKAAISSDTPALPDDSAM